MIALLQIFAPAKGSTANGKGWQAAMELGMLLANRLKMRRLGGKMPPSTAGETLRDARRYTWL
jgi:hypothetical protein